MDYPVIWFSEGGTGGWQRFMIKLELNNLHFDGGSLPAAKAAAQGTVRDIVDSCRAQGAVIPNIPKKATPFSQLVTKLEEMGLLQRTEEESHVVDDASQEQIEQNSSEFPRCSSCSGEKVNFITCTLYTHKFHNSTPFYLTNTP